MSTNPKKSWKTPLVRAAAAVLACLAWPAGASAQCGPSLSARFGGEVSAVAQVNVGNLLVAHGTEVELYSLANPAAPVPYSPHRKVAVSGPVVKISMTPSSPRAFVLLRDGTVQIVNLVYLPSISINGPATISFSNAVDILADGQRVYVAAEEENPYDDPPNVYSAIYAYDDTTGTPTYAWSVSPLSDIDGYDRLARVGNTLWAGFHEVASSILGVDGFNLAAPGTPTRTAAALTNAPLGVYTHVSAMTSVGNTLLVSYLHDEFPSNEWLRPVNVTSPTSPTWLAGASLSGEASCMAPLASQLRIAIKNSGIGTWDVSNPSSLVWQGAYFDSFPDVGQMVSSTTTDYWAGGRAGLMTMNETNPASVGARSAPIVPTPTAPYAVRQRGNTTAVLDFTLNVLRLYDYTLPEPQQLRGTISLPYDSQRLELADLSGGAIILACVAAPDSIAIIDITNPAAPVTRSTITGFYNSMMTASGSRLYVFTTTSDLRIYELAQPLSPALRSTTHFGGYYPDYTCMASWSNNALALGTGPYGLWLINTTDATAPLVSSVWNPVPGYRVNALAKGNNYLYVSASVGPTAYQTTDTRLESLTVTNLANPTQRYVDSSNTGTGFPGAFTSLAYVSSPAAKFLVGMSDHLTLFELPPGFFTNEGVPFRTADVSVEYAHGNVAASADGSHLLAAADDAGLYQVAMPNSWAPGFGLRPFDQHACVGGTVNLSAIASGNPTTVTYQWYRDSAPLVNGPTPWGSSISGATDIALVINNVQTQDSKTGPYAYHYYTCVASNSCGSTTSAYAFVTVSTADFNGDGDLGTDADIAAFFACLAGNCCYTCGSADFNGDGDIGTDADIAAFFRVLAGGAC